MRAGVMVVMMEVVVSSSDHDDVSDGDKETWGG